jgi:hypothetical protein
MTRPKAIFYIDGFNLYNGLVRRAEAKELPAPEHRWLNLGKLAQFLAPEAEISKVKYFTSRVKRRIDNPDAEIRQEVFLRALRSLPNVEIHLGQFQRNKQWRRLVDDPSQSVRIIDFKEKGSDVNLATHLVHDALAGNCEMACVISSDSDLVEPVRVAGAHLPAGAIVFSPNVGKPARALARVATDSRQISDAALAACHLVDTLNDANGTITKPDSW